MGRILREWHDQARPHGWPASAFEGLYQSHAMLNGEHIPKPLGIRVTDNGASIAIELRLFGEAAMWRDDVIEAMTTALAIGIGLWENGKILRPWPLADWWWEQHSRRSIPPFSSRVVLGFETPFKPGGSDLFAGDLAFGLRGLVKRITGLARWSGLDVERSGALLFATLSDLGLAELPPDHSLDGFIKHDARGGLAVVGLLGQTQITGISREFWPYLMLGQDIGIGGHRAYGFGRYWCESTGPCLSSEHSSAERKPSSDNAKGSNDKPSNIGDCNTES